MVASGAASGALKNWIFPRLFDATVTVAQPELGGIFDRLILYNVEFDASRFWNNYRKGER
jgi:hypothetical protein